LDFLNEDNNNIYQQLSHDQMWLYYFWIIK
jgi:hypothetical protein